MKFMTPPHLRLISLKRDVSRMAVGQLFIKDQIKYITGFEMSNITKTILAVLGGMLIVLATIIAYSFAIIPSNLSNPRFVILFVVSIIGAVSTIYLSYKNR